MHIGYITQALYCRVTRIAYVADLKHKLSVLTCSMNHHTTGPEHSMSTVEKFTILHHNVKATCMRQYRAYVI